MPNSERLLSSITTAESRLYKEHLQLTPANAKKKYADLSPSESVKAASDVYSPISGEVTEVNQVLSDNPEIINTSPYEEGWFIKIKPQDINELAELLDSEAYKKISES